MTATDEVLVELEKIPWIQEIQARHRLRIASMTTLRQVKAGQVLFREGDREDYVYIVMLGRVALDMFVPHRGKVRFYTADPWEIVGWSSVTPTVRQRTAGASAVVDGMLACIEAEQLRQACEDDHDLGYEVMRRLANVVAARLLVTRLQLLDMFARPGAKND